MAERNFKYFYDIFGIPCEQDARWLIVASEIPIKKSNITDCAINNYKQLSNIGIKVGEVVNIIFGDPRSVNGLKKLSKRKKNLPDFINDRSDSCIFAVYEFPNKQQAVLDENWVCDRNAKK
ncbi:hypothetical protein ACFL1Y_01030 [Patescibacteria group bacterium]